VWKWYQDDWTYGIRNVTADGGGIDYDPVNNFIPFPTDGGAGQKSQSSSRIAFFFGLDNA
jgi:hypothetical protein